MAKSKSRRPFESSADLSRSDGFADQSTKSVGGFLRDRGIRETIESVVIAIMLALLFRCFEAEAFIIPTGSMAVSLYGEHLDVSCDQCGYQYQVGASKESEDNRRVSAFCPICQFNMQLHRNRLDKRFTVNHETYDGDRILANKFIYCFTDPKRWDVIIFKNPNNPKQNYIKRCIGLPYETVVIENGDIYTYVTETETIADKKLQRKPPNKIWHILQVVDDTKFIGQQLKIANWPSRWNQHDDPANQRVWQIDSSGDTTTFSAVANGTEKQWLRYRHIIPRWYEWDPYIQSNKLPPRVSQGYLGELISDYYAYNHYQEAGELHHSANAREPLNDKKFMAEAAPQPPGTAPSTQREYIQETIRHWYDQRLGMHWVGDLCVDAELNIEEATGQLVIQLVEGGAPFNCTIDLDSGMASLSCSDPSVTFVDEDGNETDATESDKRVIRGTGKYKIRFANFDDRMALWVNKKLIKFGGNGFLNYNRKGKVRPKWSDKKGQRGDAEPVGFAASGGAKLTINRLRVLRDIYYISITDKRGRGGYFGQRAHEYGDQRFGNGLGPETVRQYLTSPTLWETQNGVDFFDARTPEDDPAEYVIPGSAFMPMGDNSPFSLDSRSWSVSPGGNRADPFFERKYLSGRAMIIYWPHTWNSPPYWPNFKRMKFIH